MQPLLQIWSYVAFCIPTLPAFDLDVGLNGADGWVILCSDIVWHAREQKRTNNYH